MSNRDSIHMIKLSGVLALLLGSLLLTGCILPSQPSSHVVPDQPPKPQVTVLATPVITAPAQPGIANNHSSVIVTGTCLIGATVSLGGDVEATDVSSPVWGEASQHCHTGSFQFNVTKFVDGLFQIVVYQEKGTDRSADASVYWLRDIYGPAAVVLSAPMTSPHYGSNSDTALTIQGSCEDLATVNITGDATQSVTCAGGTFSTTVMKPMGMINSFLFNIQQVDLASNVSPPITLRWERQAPPPAPAIVSPMMNPHMDSANSITITGTCVSGYDIIVSGDVLAFEVSDAQLVHKCVSGGFSFAIGKTVDGTYNFSFVQRSNFGEVSAPVVQQWIRGI